LEERKMEKSTGLELQGKVYQQKKRSDVEMVEEITVWDE
jgi:hypothetical protein